MNWIFFVILLFFWMKIIVDLIFLIYRLMLVILKYMWGLVYMLVKLFYLSSFEEDFLYVSIDFLEFILDIFCCEFKVNWKFYLERILKLLILVMIFFVCKLFLIMVNLF